MAQTVKVELGERSYDILMGGGLLNTLGALVASRVKGRTGLVVTDATVGALYGQAALESLTAAGLRVGRAVVPAGEASKDGRWLFHLYEQAVEQGLDRQSFVVALGGGVVGDLAGFMAATFLRGIPYIQVPTTLLAMVDSAVGGKTGINLPQGKNLVGAFYQPAHVICDLDTLKSLPARELAAGLAEVIKYGVIRDAGLFAFLEKELEPILRGDPERRREIVARSCAIKAEVVGRDERESGLRAILNFGHTAGHAVEAVTGYGRYLHGEAIAIGMVFAAKVSCAARNFPGEEYARLVRLIQRAGLPTEASDLPWLSIAAAMGVDKKGIGGRPRFVLADRLGSVTPGCEVDEHLLQKMWENKNEASRLGF
jgi:3-dehydroquinate synthase